MKNRPYLTSLSDNAKREFSLNRGEISIGGDPGNDVVIADQTVSRRHAKLIRYGGAYRLIDLNSTNGTFVNGRRIDAPTSIKSGDELRFGAARLTLSDPAAVSALGELDRPAARRRRSRPLAIATVAAFLLAGFVIGEYLLDWDQIEQAADTATSSGKSPATHSDVLRAAPDHPGYAPAATPTPRIRHATPAEIAAAQAWLGPLNHYRAMAGLGPVEPDPTLSAADAAHAHYLITNFAHRIKANVLGIEAHTEDPSKADYSPAGAEAAAASDVEEGYNPHSSQWLKPASAITGWISLPFHRLWILNPNLLRAGYGQYCEMGVCVGAVDVGTDIVPLRDTIAPYPKPIEFPPDGSTLPVLSAEGEWPDPLTACPGYSQPMGLPVTLQLGSYVDPKLTAYSLRNDGDGSALDVCAFDAATYTNPDPAQQARGRSVLSMFGAVVMIPRAPLAPGAYTVSITADGRPYEWSFTAPEPS
ncbi:MAG TPA: FHA domain-containing protein [Candidatus Binataceae bacterium]|nr:FHA domain-containing protein [Candidatus Binataceae bacterium]